MKKENLYASGKMTINYKTYSIILLCSLINVGLITPAISQDISQHNPVNYTLTNIVSLAQHKSISFLKAKTVKENSYWQWRTYKSDYNPQLALSGTLPEFNRSYLEIYQPNGSLQFQPVSFSNTNLGLSLSQAISPTGGTIFFRSEVQRYDDFQGKSSQFKAIPFQIGLVQPILKYNELKWNKKIEPLKYSESLKAFFEEIENIGMITTTLYFDVLRTQVGHYIATSNFENNERMLNIATERYKLGKTSKNDVLQLQLALMNARKELANMKVESETAQLNLKKYVGIAGGEKMNLCIPANIIAFNVDPEIALLNAWENRKDPVSYNRLLQEAEAQIARARGENGFSADLIASLGFNNTAVQFGETYGNFKEQQYVSLSLVLPVLDWGRSKSRMQTALANKQLVEYTVEQDQINFEQEIIIQVNQFDLNYQQLEYTGSADTIAAERYKIALDRYTIGDISITDLIIAMNEKDQARVDYINALYNYWIAYYRLRLLTLYDFENNNKIEY